MDRSGAGEAAVGAGDVLTESAIAVDGAPTKSRLGAHAVIGVSLAVARAEIERTPLPEPAAAAGGAGCGLERASPRLDRTARLWRRQTAAPTRCGPGRGGGMRQEYEELTARWLMVPTGLEIDLAPSCGSGTCATAERDDEEPGYGHGLRYAGEERVAARAGICRHCGAPWPAAALLQRSRGCVGRCAAEAGRTPDTMAPAP
ncbi:hypothetical protein NGF19_29500 [Streptomyces sp. RY43-2]|uniref:Uncharacterized protein n=1 Tax=Streptomyces macrolidinus TaxID=2952607 RepID=A0ABT0ZMW6_9ACTN|nr:hypothetical protein [Streptomyces macrolidinus]MCN9244868.1 hypothetical protein [Streptomyces macrolidinus]